MKEKVIYSKKLAAYLRQAGYNLIKVGVNENYPQYNTYIFIDENNIQDAINQYSNNK